MSSYRRKSAIFQKVTQFLQSTVVQRSLSEFVDAALEFCIVGNVSMREKL